MILPKSASPTLSSATYLSKHHEVEAEATVELLVTIVLSSEIGNLLGFQTLTINWPRHKMSHFLGLDCS